MAHVLMILLTCMHVKDMTLLTIRCSGAGEAAAHTATRSAGGAPCILNAC